MTALARLTLPLATMASGQRPWFEEHLASPLLRQGPRGLLWWQWLAMPIALALAVAAGFALGWLTRQLLGRIFERTPTTWDDQLLARLGAPLTALWAIGAAYLLSRWLALGETAERAVGQALHAATILVLFWGALRTVDLSFRFAAESPWGKAHAVGVGLLPIGRKVAQISVVAMGLIAFLTELGYPVASLLAGLGIGGLALALAAQKTVENLFGSVAIGVDQPFRVGDFVRIENVTGTVESVGLRSTRIRTLDRTLVSIPNGKLADMRTETFAPRDRIRLSCNLGLVYSTTASQMSAVLGGVEKVLRAHPLLWPENVTVRFVALSASSLDVEVNAWFRTADWNEFLAIRQEVLLQFMEVVERAGTSFAYPTQTVHLVGAAGKET